jgi:hypothetical protein
MFVVDTELDENYLENEKILIMEKVQNKKKNLFCIFPFKLPTLKIMSEENSDQPASPHSSSSDVGTSSSSMKSRFVHTQAALSTRGQTEFLRNINNSSVVNVVISEGEIDFYEFFLSIFESFFYCLIFHINATHKLELKINI